ncbi:6776_t:CDS:1, partial [Acaulospora colombiana]
MLAFSTMNAVPAPVKRGGQFTGHATFYAPGLGACGITNTAQDLIVAL